MLTASPLFILRKSGPESIRGDGNPLIEKQLDPCIRLLEDLESSTVAWHEGRKVRIATAGRRLSPAFQTPATAAFCDDVARLCYRGPVLIVATFGKQGVHGSWR